MSDRETRALPVGESWDTYWRGAGYGAAYSSDGISHPAIQAFWDEFFRTARVEYGAPNVIDIASGNGAILEYAATAFDGQLPDFTCVDVSSSALSALNQRYPAVHTVVADACKIPLDSSGFDIATSLFGIEYAGHDAISEVARLIASGGRLAFLLHNRAGRIYQECVISLDAIEKLQQAEFIPYAIAMFEKGFAACRGADRTDYEAAAKQLAPAVRALESIMTEHGKHVTGNLVLQLYDDVATIHEHIQQYEPVEVLNWLNRMEIELQALSGRMASMRDAAVDSNTFEQWCKALRKQAFSIVRADALTESQQQPPLAWALIAARD